MIDSVHGTVAPGWEPVREAFVANFRERKEVGAACAVFHRGKKTVDLWGGWRDPATRAPWEEDTLVTVFSTTKGMSSLAMAVAHSRGLFSYDERVAKYWPEFAQNGKADVTVRQLLSHQAGVCAIDEPLDLATLGDPDRLAAVIAKQKPAWEPGRKQGYHGITLGYYESELIRRVDPNRRTIGRFFADEIAAPLGLEFYIGLPDAVPDTRRAVLQARHFKLRLPFNITKLPRTFAMGFLNPRSITARTFANPKVTGVPSNYNRRDVLRIELPASNGTGLVRSIARAYSEFATGAKVLGVRAETLEELSRTAPPPPDDPLDVVTRLPARYSLGFSKPSERFPFGSERAFGTPGAGGSFGFADPEIELGFAYAMTRMDYYLHSDPREKSLRDAARACAAAAR